MTSEELANELIMEIHNALARGTKHYDIHGTFLATDREIIEAVIRDRQIIFEPIKAAKAGE